ncbi:hypothetical protein BN1723_020160, partial [Verticillium longisporum]
CREPAGQAQQDPSSEPRHGRDAAHLLQQEPWRFEQDARFQQGHNAQPQLRDSHGELAQQPGRQRGARE